MFNRPTIANPALQSLMRPIGGLFAGASAPTPIRGEPAFETRVVTLGSLGALGIKGANESINGAKVRPLSGAGTAPDGSYAMVLALAEGLERYCMYVQNQNTHFVRASANELGSEAIELDIVPRCSDNELAHPKCVLVRPDSSVPMRWVKSLSLSNGRVVYVPAVMVYLNAGFCSKDERIC